MSRPSTVVRTPPDTCQTHLKSHRTVAGYGHLWLIKIPPAHPATADNFFQHTVYMAVTSPMDGRGHNAHQAKHDNQPQEDWRVRLR